MQHKQRITVQLAIHPRYVPDIKRLEAWAHQVLNKKSKRQGEVTIRIIGKKEMTYLNQQYREKKGPTNVLSFPYHEPANVRKRASKPAISLLGDIAICAPVVNKEAKIQNKSRDAHWAHILTHGILHLLGYDHDTDDDAVIMENLEIKLLKQLGFTNPYREETLPHHG